MNGRATKEKVVSSGRLTGLVRGSRGTPDSGPVVRPEPLYSLYSSDSEDQVTSLHKGLDHCAALLNGILQAEQTASPGLPRTPKRLTTKSKASTSQQGKKVMKKVPPKTGLPRTIKPGASRSRSSSSQGKSGLRKLQIKPDLQNSQPAPHSGVKLHPSQKRTLQSPPPATQNHIPQPALTCVPPPQTFIQLQTSCPSVPEVPPWGGPQDVPVRDSDVQASCGGSCPTMVVNLQDQPGVPEDSSKREGDSRRTGPGAETVHCLLGELKALIAGRGSVAEQLLRRLEQVVFSQMNTGSPSEPSWSRSSQLSRCVKTPNQQVEQKVSEPRKQEMLYISEVVSLKEDLTAAQSRLQELQVDFTELRKAFQDTQSQLRDAEAEKTLLETDLKASRNLLQQTEQQNTELASLAQQRLEEIGDLQRRLQGQRSSVEVPNIPEQDPPAPSSDRVQHYLMSLSQTALTPPCRVGVAPHHHARPQQGIDPEPHPPLSRSQVVQSSGPLVNSYSCDLESVYSYRSARSSSTFDTRDEVAFRDGLAALDASIASLQRTLQLDLKT